MMASKISPGFPRKRFQRGSAAPKIIAAVVVLALVAAVGIWFATREEASTALPGAASPTATTAPASPAEPAPATPAVEELSIDQLYREARKALAEQRMVAPAGNNALEYYLAILAKDVGNAGAQDALRELFPFASGTAEQAINNGDIDEATRIIEQLAKADPSNYTLTILRSKLDAKRKLVEREAQAAATAAAAAARPTTTPTGTAPAASPPASSEPAATSAASTAAASTPAAPPAATPTPPPAETRPAAAPAPAPATPAVSAPAPSGETRDAGVTQAAAPTYPAQAARARTEGWVEVEFTITPEGRVANARVTRSDPPRLFDREALRSVENSTYRPRVENGVPVSSSLRRRIEFKLN